MDGSRFHVFLVFAAAVLTAGCTSSRWSSDGGARTWSSSPSETGAPAAYPSTGAIEGGEFASPAQPVQAESQALLDVVAEVRRLGALDPAAEAELLANLRQTPPDLWPLMVQQFRAALAYRQRAAEGNPNEPRPGPPAEEVLSARAALATDSPPAVASDYPPAGKVVAAKIEPQQPAPMPPASQPAPRPLPGITPAGSAGDVLPVSCVDGASTWQTHLDQTIRLLESQVSPAPASSEQIAQHARLRMLYLLSGRRDDALKPIPAVAPGTQDFWSNEFYGLASLLEGASGGSPSRLAADAHRPLSDAVARLGESCPLLLGNLAFVTEVQSYGVFKRFAKYEFAPGQKLLLYAEVENFKSTEMEKGFRTELKSSYEILDSSGRRVAEHEFKANEEYCANRRRDFFIGYEFLLPERIYPGKHVLRLTVEDTASGKVGESSIEFTVTAENRR